MGRYAKVRRLAASQGGFCEGVKDEDARRVGHVPVIRDMCGVLWGGDAAFICGLGCGERRRCTAQLRASDPTRIRATPRIRGSEQRARIRGSETDKTLLRDHLSHHLSLVV